jgi:glycosyltransferase involved in cell wall biosynthesis
MVIDSWEDARTGAVISTMRFAEALRERGHTVNILAAGRPQPHKVLFPTLAIPVFGWIVRRMRIVLARPSRKILEQSLPGHDVVHVHFPFFLGVAAVRTAQRMGIPVVSTFHIQAEHIAFNIGLRGQWVLSLIYSIFLKTIYNRSGLVVCPSRFAEEELKRFGVTTSTRVISNGLPSRYRPLPPEQVERYPGRFVILTVGRLAPEKRHHLIIEAIRRSRHESSIQLILIGDGPLRKKLQRRYASLTNPTVTGLLDPEQLVGVYNSADLYVHAAEVEVECMTVLEAMGCGTPCLIADAPKSATPQFALSPEFLFQVNDVESLREKIDYWIEHAYRLPPMRLRAVAEADKYRFDRSVERLEHGYRSVLRRGLTGA